MCAAGHVPVRHRMERQRVRSSAVHAVVCRQLDMRLARHVPMQRGMDRRWLRPGDLQPAVRRHAWHVHRTGYVHLRYRMDWLDVRGRDRLPDRHVRRERVLRRRRRMLLRCRMVRPTGLHHARVLDVCPRLVRRTEHMQLRHRLVRRWVRQRDLHDRVYREPRVQRT